MKNSIVPSSKPKGLLKWAFTLPLYLYRWHLGWLVGHSYLMLTHLGRKTGRRRQTGLEVAHYDPGTKECIVVAAWGERTDWYRNIQAHPALEVHVGSKRYRPVQRFLTFEETWALLSEYQHHHPRRLRVLLHLLAGYPYHGSKEELLAIAQVVRCVAFRPPQQSETAATPMMGYKRRQFAPLIYSEAENEEIATENAKHHDWITQKGRKSREVHGYDLGTVDCKVSVTNPDATPTRLKQGGIHLGNHTHYVADGGKTRYHQPATYQKVMNELSGWLVSRVKKMVC